ncbi:D-aminoacyl-tRNA deacylase-like [Varroa destructor]|uniref:D-aminoacyl-tRNA deacylase n=1 Tax=Varroa destructor TaxID=109461 RepID=A0A7M7KUL2_VARDE|nr:D-aminoacyl-tRNA deacylase-like [Varroa destructor]
MKAIIQRVRRAKVTVNDEIVSSVGRGLCVLLGIHRDDTSSDLEYVVRKILSIRLFDADGQKWRKSVQDENLEILCVSQFTLHSTLKGNKPNFHLSMGADEAKEMYNEFLRAMKKGYCEDRIKDGRFGEYMQVHIENDGPVTIVLNSRDDSTNE